MHFFFSFFFALISFDQWHKLWELVYAAWIQPEHNGSNTYAKKKSVHLHADEFRVLDRLPRGYIDIKSGSWHVMKLFPPAQLHTTKDLDGTIIQPPLKLQRISQFVLVSRHLFFSPSYIFQCCCRSEKKKKVGWKWHFWFPQYEHSTAVSQHLLTPSINGLMVSAGIPSAPTVRPQIWDPSRCAATI